MIAVAALLTACAKTPKVFSRKDPTADFSNYRTYGYYDNPATNNASYESLRTNFLKVAVAQQLVARGLGYDPVDPDVIVTSSLTLRRRCVHAPCPA